MVPGKKLLLGGLASLAAITGSELALRVLAPQPASWMDIFRRHPTLPIFGVAPNLARFADTGESQWHVYTDAHGLRVSAQGRAIKPRALDLLAIGDSFTFGYAVEYEDSIPARLDAMAGDRWRVINAGQPAYGPAQYRMHLEHLLASGFEPRAIVLVLFAGNDLFDAMIDKDQPVRDGIIGNPGGMREWLKRRSHLYRLACRVMHVVWTRSPHFIHTSIDLMKPEFWEREEIRKAWATCRAEIGRFAAICKERDIDLFVGILPAPVSVDRRREPAAAQDGLDFDLPVRRFAAACAEHDIPFLDLTDALLPRPSPETFLPFDGHLNPLGNALVARALYDRCAFLNGGEVGSGR
jgi:lysophospholipase L1-like esterase